MFGDELHLLDEGIEKQTRLVDTWRKPAEPLLFEALRAIDWLYMREHFSSERAWSPEDYLSERGVNKVIEKTMPHVLGHGPFRLFPSTLSTQEKADEFLLQSGILQRAETLRNWIGEGLVNVRLGSVHKSRRSRIRNVLVLKSAHPTLFSEIISHKHREWMGELVARHDDTWEKQIQERHAAIEPELDRRVNKSGWSMGYSTTQQIDRHFLECGQLYLRRKWSQDLLAQDDKMGGEEFASYLAVLAALSGVAQKHLCCASLLKRRHPELDLRNLLTTFAPRVEFTDALAAYLDADSLQIQKLMSCLTLEPTNTAIHTHSDDIVWAPIVQANSDYYILPQYGLDINPFLFLLKDLRAKYPSDWFRAANNRERRWLSELKTLFSGERWKTYDRSLKLRDGPKTLTDVDFVVYDKVNNELGLFQLKWQHPVGADDRARRSAGKNLLNEGKRWIETVRNWLQRYGAEELAKRAGISSRPGVSIELFIIARYNAFFSGFDNRNSHAAWADWNHLLKTRVRQPEETLQELAITLTTQTAEIMTAYEGESYFVPLGDLMLILNPSQEPSQQR